MATENKKSYAQRKDNADDNEDNSFQLPRKPAKSENEDLFQTSHEENVNGSRDTFDISGVEKVSFFSDEEEEEETWEPGQRNDDPGVHSPMEEKDDPFKTQIIENEDPFRMADEERNSEEGEDKNSEKDDDRTDEIEDDEDREEDAMQVMGDVDEARSKDMNSSRDVTNLTSTSMTFQGIDQEDSDPDIDELVEDCAYLPEV